MGLSFNLSSAAGVAPPAEFPKRTEGGDMNDRLATSDRFAILARACVAALVAGLLAGCVDMALHAPEPAAPVHPTTNMARRQGVSPAGASIALAGFAGAQQALADQFKVYFVKEAKQRDVNVTEADKANYLIRGYLNAYPQDAGTAVAFVLDVFDADRQRAQRIEDQVIVKATAADPWSLVDQAVLAAVAAKSADDLANFLTNTPEAIAASEARPASGRQLADSGQTTIASSTPPASPPTPLPPPRGAGLASLH
jgi:hypothetical protein